MTIDVPNHEMTEEQLLVAAKAGDPAAFVMLVARTEGRAKAIAKARVHDDYKAEEVLQQAYLKAWREIKTCKGPRFAPWFFSIVRNEACNLQNKKTMQSLDFDSKVSQATERADASYDPSQEAIRIEVANQLHSSIERLPPSLKQIVIPYYGEGRPLADVAKRAGISTKAAKTRLCRARKLIKDYLEATGVNSDD